MKCALCGVDSAIEMKHGIVSIQGTLHRVFACPNCGNLKVEVDGDLSANKSSKNRFEGCKCPFCGNTHEDEFATRKWRRGVADYPWENFNMCCSCGAVGPDTRSEKEAIEKFKTGGQ
jgi:hypothetical protein